MPNTLARSVSASAGMPSATAAATASSRRTMPSVTEYSLCSLRWTNGSWDMTDILRRAREFLTAALHLDTNDFFRDCDLTTGPIAARFKGHATNSTLNRARARGELGPRANCIPLGHAGRQRRL